MEKREWTREMRTVSSANLDGKTGIYALINYDNGRAYIGQSVNLGKRSKTHFWMLRNGRHPNKHLQKAYDQDPQAFGFRVVAFCEREELNDLERDAIAHLGYYNMCEGGDGTQGRICTEETRRKISEATRGKMTDERKAEKTAQLVSYNKSEEGRRKASERFKGREPWNKGRACPEEQKRKVSEKLKGREITTEHREKLREMYSGENSKTAKLTESEVIEMRLRFLSGEPRLSIAKDFPQVSAGTVYDIVKGKRWKTVPNTIEELKRRLYD